MSNSKTSNMVEHQVIGHVRSCFAEKFGVPRQSGLAPAAQAELILAPEYRHPDGFRGLEGFSHLWLLFVFHANSGSKRQWQATVRPPRLGGNEKLGVWASRSPFRPNPIGLSAVQLLEVGEHSLKLANVDLVDGTPILDIKPYLPYADCLPNANGGFAAERPAARYPVLFSAAAEQQLAEQPQLRALIEQVLALDPRPAYQRQTDNEREYGTTLGGYNVRWLVRQEQVHVCSLTLAADSLK